nr:conserved hypothetical protein [Ipomoea batatas]
MGRQLNMFFFIVTCYEGIGDGWVNNSRGMICRMGRGLYAWDRIGSVMAIGAVGKVGDVLPREAETLAVREALSWLKGQAFDGVLIEIVALQIIN